MQSRHSASQSGCCGILDDQDRAPAGEMRHAPCCCPAPIKYPQLKVHKRLCALDGLFFWRASLTSKHALVTGAYGIVGLNVIKELQTRGDWSVLAIGRREKPPVPDLAYVRADLLDPQ